MSHAAPKPNCTRAGSQSQSVPSEMSFMRSQVSRPCFINNQKSKVARYSPLISLYHADRVGRDRHIPAIMKYIFIQIYFLTSMRRVYIRISFAHRKPYPFYSILFIYCMETTSQRDLGADLCWLNDGICTQ